MAAGGRGLGSLGTDANLLRACVPFPGLGSSATRAGDPTYWEKPTTQETTAAVPGRRTAGRLCRAAEALHEERFVRGH
jgi:hypothetical protein